MCEGARAEWTYLRKARSALRLSKENVIIESTDGGSPDSIVRHARERAKELRRAPREERIDEAWVVFDVEDAATSGARGAASAASDSDVQPALSNPSFEIWLLLHVDRQGASMTAGQAKQRCASELNIPGPQNRPAVFDDPRLVNGQDTAAANARRDREAIAVDEGLSGDTPQYIVVLARNPASNVDELIQAMTRARAGRA